MDPLRRGRPPPAPGARPGAIRRRVVTPPGALRVQPESDPPLVDEHLLAELMAPVPGLGQDLSVDVSSFQQIIFMDAGAKQETKDRRPARGLASLLNAPPRLPESCAICLADFEHGDRLRALPCDGSHVLHESCLQRWLSRNPSCPCCRENVQPRAVELDPVIARQVLQARMARATGQGSASRSFSARSHTARTSVVSERTVPRRSASTSRR